MILDSQWNKRIHWLSSVKSSVSGLGSPSRSQENEMAQIKQQPGSFLQCCCKDFNISMTSDLLERKPFQGP